VKKLSPTAAASKRPLQRALLRTPGDGLATALDIFTTSERFADNKKPAEAGFFPDHSKILLAAVLAMADHP